jgi:hypothetical protein
MLIEPTMDFCRAEGDIVGAVFESGKIDSSVLSYRPKVKKREREKE